MSIFGWSYPAGCSGTPYDDEGPEVCPMCGKPNADEETGESLCQAAPGYCSPSCQAHDVERMRAEAEAEAAWLATLAEVEDSWR